MVTSCHYNFLYIFFDSGGGYPLYLEILKYYTMILQRPRIIVGDAGFEPGTKSGALPNEPPHYNCIFKDI